MQIDELIRSRPRSETEKKEANLALIDLGEISMTLWKDLNAVAFQESGHENMFLIISF
jgi:hypothetical protein